MGNIEIFRRSILLTINIQWWFYLTESINCGGWGLGRIDFFYWDYRGAMKKVFIALWKERFNSFQDWDTWNNFQINFSIFRRYQLRIFMTIWEVFTKFPKDFRIMKWFSSFTIKKSSWFESVRVRWLSVFRWLKKAFEVNWPIADPYESFHIKMKAFVMLQ